MERKAREDFIREFYQRGAHLPPSVRKRKHEDFYVNEEQPTGDVTPLFEYGNDFIEAEYAESPPPPGDTPDAFDKARWQKDLDAAQKRNAGLFHRLMAAEDELDQTKGNVNTVTVGIFSLLVIAGIIGVDQYMMIEKQGATIERLEDDVLDASKENRELQKKLD